MDAVQGTFVSSTFWTERVGFTAALATLEKYEKNKVHLHLIECGETINKSWNGLAELTGIDISICGLTPLTHIDFNYPNAACLQTIYTQEMLKKGHLLGSSVYATHAYDVDVLGKFHDDSYTAFKTIKEAIDSGRPEDFLISDIKHSGFQRLT